METLHPYVILQASVGDILEPQREFDGKTRETKDRNHRDDALSSSKLRNDSRPFHSKQLRESTLGVAFLCKTLNDCSIYGSGWLNAELLHSVERVPQINVRTFGLCLEV